MNGYRNGEWFGNSSLDGVTIFKSATYTFSDLVNTFSYAGDGEKVSFSNKTVIKILKPRPINDRTFGRCFEIMLLNENKHITMVDINFKQSIYIYINIPFRFWELHTRSKLQANVNEDLFMEVNYEIHKKNYGKKCKKYSNNYYQSFDRCQTLDQEKRIIEKFNCTVPFLAFVGSEICRGAAAEKANKLYLQIAQNSSCSSPCHNMMSWFGYPFITQKPHYNGTGFARLYFRKIIKETEDFMSYDLLRCFTIYPPLSIIF